MVNATQNAQNSICTQFLVVPRSQALRRNSDLCLSVTLLDFLLYLNSLQSDFSRPFFSLGCAQEKKNFQLTLLLSVH